MVLSPSSGRFAISDTIDKTSPLPYYVQLKEIIRAHIDNGDWAVGNQIPSEPELCELYGISRTVVRQALKELNYEGLLVREKGRGTYVSKPKISEGLVQELTGFYENMLAMGIHPISQVLKQQVTAANSKVAASLGLPVGTPVVEIQRLRFVNKEPIVLVTTYLPYAICPGLLEADLRQQSMYKFIENECGLFIARGRRTIEAVPANEYEAQLLQVQKGAPLILLDSVSFLEDGKPVEYYHALHRGDRSRFEVELVRRNDTLKG
jgi:GntR family transcriptional regulator